MPGVPSAPELRTDYLRFDPRDSRGSVEVPIKAHDLWLRTVERKRRVVAVHKSML